MYALNLPLPLEQKVNYVSSNVGKSKNDFIIEAISFYLDKFSKEMPEKNLSQDNENYYQNYLVAPNAETLEAIEELNSGKLKTMSLEEFKRELRAMSDA